MRIGRLVGQIDRQRVCQVVVRVAVVAAVIRRLSPRKDAGKMKCLQVLSAPDGRTPISEDAKDR